MNVITHRGETGPKARGELKKGDTGYCEQEDVDHPIKWESATVSFGTFVRKLLEIAPHLKEQRLTSTSIDTMLNEVEPIVMKGIPVSPPSTDKAISISASSEQDIKPYQGSYTLSQPQISPDKQSVVIELRTDSFGQENDAGNIERILLAHQKSGPEGFVIKKRLVRGPSVISVTLSINTPDQGTNSAVVEIAKRELTKFVIDALPGIKQDKSLI